MEISDQVEEAALRIEDLLSMLHRCVPNKRVGGADFAPARLSVADFRFETLSIYQGLMSVAIAEPARNLRPVSAACSRISTS